MMKLKPAAVLKPHSQKTLDGVANTCNLTVWLQGQAHLGPLPSESTPPNIYPTQWRRYRNEESTLM